MEPYDVLRVISLVVVWGIPALLVLAVVVFILAAPILTLAGAVLRLCEAVGNKIRGRARAEGQLPIDIQAVQETGTAYDDTTAEAAQEHTAKKEVVGTKT